MAITMRAKVVAKDREDWACTKPTQYYITACAKEVLVD